MLKAVLYCSTMLSAWVSPKRTDDPECHTAEGRNALLWYKYMQIVCLGQREWEAEVGLLQEVRSIICLDCGCDLCWHWPVSTLFLELQRLLLVA